MDHKCQVTTQAVQDATLMLILSSCLKYLGFSLTDTREMTLGSGDRHLLLDSLQIQKRLVEERLKEMQNVAVTIDSTSST